MGCPLAGVAGERLCDRACAVTRSHPTPTVVPSVARRKMDPAINVSRGNGVPDYAALVEVLEEPRDTVILYGSSARGDATPDSDVDLLQIVPYQRPSYRRGRLSVTTVTEQSLRTLALSGSLFVLHLREEGIL